VSLATAITDVSVATIQGSLPAPVVFGDWIMRHREYAVVRVSTASGHVGWAFTLTRDGTVAEQIRKTIAPVYVGEDPADRQRLFRIASRGGETLVMPLAVSSPYSVSRAVSPPVTPTIGRNRGGRAVYMIDPDGFRVELIQSSVGFGEYQPDEAVAAPPSGCC